MTHFAGPDRWVEFHKVLGPLVDPVAHGGRAEDAFHVVPLVARLRIFREA